MKRTLVSLVLVLVLVLSAMPVLAEDVPTKLYLVGTSGRQYDPSASNMVELLKLTNVELEYEDVKADTIPSRFASGNLPDAMLLSANSFRDYLDSGYLMDITDLLNEYAPNIMAHTSQAAWDMVAVGGRYFCYPMENNNSKYRLSVRKDWLDACGIDLTGHEMVDNFGYYVTLDEYTEMLEAMTFDDPDGNEDVQTYGLSAGSQGANDSYKLFMHIYGAFGGIIGQSYNIDGEVLPFEVTDNYRAALTYLNEMWNLGVIDPEAFVLKQDQANQRISNNITGSYISWWNGSDQLQNMTETAPNAEFIPLWVTSNDGTKCGTMDNGRISNTVVITTKCQEPEKLIQFLNFLSSDEGYLLYNYGIEGEHYTLDEDGFMARTELGNQLNQALVLNPLYGYGNRLDIMNWSDSTPVKEPGFQQIRYWWVKLQYVDTPLYSDLFYGMANTQAKNELGVDVDQYVRTKNMEFITGEIELTDETWDAYIQGWIDVGGLTITQSYVDAYNDVNGTNLVLGL